MMKQVEESMVYDFTLKAVFIFNPQAIPKTNKPSEQDIQDAKLIYYYPSKAEIDEKRIQTGMAEGIFVFFDTFNSNKMDEAGFHVIYLESQTHIIYRLRVDYFVFMTLTHKSNMKIQTIQDEYFYSECHKFYFSTNKSLYTNVCQDFIDNFQLFYGMDHQYLDQFIPKWIQCNSRGQNMLNLLNFQCPSFKYAGVDSSIFLRLQYLLTMIQQLETNIEDVLVFYNGYFVYSSMPHKIALLFKEHYYGSGLPWTMYEQKTQMKMNYQESNHFAYMNFNNLRNIHKEGTFIPQYLNDKHFFTFLERAFMVIMITKPLKELGDMGKVSTAISKNVEKLTLKLDTFMESKQDLVRYLYFNGMNLAYKISSQLQINKISVENLRLLAQVYEKLDTCSQYVLRQGGTWFVGEKVIEKRVIFILPASIQLSKLEEEIAKISEQTFPNLLL